MRCVWLVTGGFAALALLCLAPGCGKARHAGPAPAGTPPPSVAYVPAASLERAAEVFDPTLPWEPPISWSPDGRFLAAALPRRGRGYRLVVVDTRDWRVCPVPGGTNDDRTPSWHPTRPEIVFDRRLADRSRLVVADVATGAESVLLDEPCVAAAPLWSPKGDRIAYQRVTVADQEYWLEPRLLTPSAHEDVALLPESQCASTGAPGLIQTLVRWSPDGAHVLCSAADSGVYSVGGEGHIAWRGPGVRDAGWHPDGRTFAYTPSSENSDVRIANMDGGETTHSFGPTAAVDRLTWSPTGGDLACVISQRNTPSPVGCHLAVLSRDGQQSRGTVRLPSYPQVLSWSPSGRRLLCATLADIDRRVGGDTRVISLDSQASPPTRLGPTPLSDANGCARSPDGSKLAVTYGSSTGIGVLDVRYDPVRITRLAEISLDGSDSPQVLVPAH